MSSDLETVARFPVCIPMRDSLLVYTLIEQVALKTLVGAVKPVETLMRRVDLGIPIERVGFDILMSLTELVAALVERIATVGFVLMFPMGNWMLMTGNHKSLY